jgi:hypothetical protein
VERHSRSFLLAKMRGCDTEAVLKGLTRRMRAPPAAVRKTLTYPLFSSFDRPPGPKPRFSATAGRVFRTGPST